jgi:hypothetical protein
MAVGLMSAGVGDVPAGQTYLDVGQGARAAPSLYDKPLPPLRANGEGAATAIASRQWDAARSRARGVPADLVPGLLGSALESAGVRARSSVADAALAMVVSEQGRLPDPARCGGQACPLVDLVEADSSRLAALAGGLVGDDLLVAMERPPPAANRALAVGVVGRGFGGTLTSDSTRMRGYVLSTDLAPTLLARLGLPVPSQMTGEPFRGEGETDPGYLDRLADRLAAIGPRRGPVVGLAVLVWAALAAFAALAFGRRGLRAALGALAVAIAYLPAVLLLTAALEPSELAERLIVGAGTPALAILTLRLVPGFGALAIAGGVSVLGYAVDVVAGSHLTELSLAGPNPAGGVRFFGIGNELEAVIGALVPIATGAGLVAWAPGARRRTAALAFGVTAALAVAAFAPGRFGADVGAAIGLPVGAAVAAAVCLGAGRHRLALLIAAPLVALAALVAVDMASGGDAHLTRTVLKAGGFDQLAETAQRRLELSVHSFGRYARTAMFWLVVAALVAGALARHRIEGWFGDRRWAWAGLLGALGATVVATLANDSGALLLILGTAVVGATVGLAWATHAPQRDRRNHGGPVL